MDSPIARTLTEAEISERRTIGKHSRNSPERYADIEGLRLAL
jgi:hypothetical protein